MASGFLAGVGSHHVGWDGASVNKVCVASAHSVGRCIGTVVNGTPGEGPGREGGLEFVKASFVRSKQKMK